MLHVFHYIETVSPQVDSNSPVPIELGTVYTELFGSMRVEGDFFGLVDAEGTVLQVMYHSKDDQFWIEIPRPDKGGSLGRFLNFDAAADLIKSIDGLFPRDGYSGFEFQSW